MGCDLVLATDSPEVIAAASRFATERNITLSFLIEIDCGEHRSGLAAGSPEIVALARAIDAAPGLRLRGVMTHAGHSYGPRDPANVVPIAAAERDAAVSAATAIRAAGLPCDIVSIGSTPTVLYADHLRGVTEVRAGIYMLWDLAQLSRNVCRIEDIAVSVLTSVIGHNRAGRSLILDAGALALSKDIGANKYLPDAGYGYVCDVRTAARLGKLSVDVVHQEHGTVSVDDEAWFARLPVGSLVRVLPNHACITCAGYEAFDAVRGQQVVARFPRVNGW
ncbi:MAG: alanine racemase [Alphaproteobacteria bacterium]